MRTLYDTIGGTYSARRQSDPRIAAAIERAAAGCDSILNVGAGTGSYEPKSACVVAVEPSRTMLAQRPVDAAPAVQGCAEALPFGDQSFDAVLGVLTVHHWRDQTKGLSECARVASTKVVILTIDFASLANFWLFDYLAWACNECQKCRFRIRICPRCGARTAAVVVGLADYTPPRGQMR